MSTSEAGPSGGSVTIDQLIALNDELAALVRAGVPLERGLIEAGRDLRGRLGSIVGELGERMGRGEGLSEAIAHSGRAMPEIYRALVEAGVRSGRLATALEGMASIARGYSDARRAVGMALLYPLILLYLAYGLALIFVVQVAPRYVSAFDSLGLAPMKLLVGLTRLGESARYWAFIPPLLLALLALRWAWSGRSVSLDSGAIGPAFRRVPMIGSMIGYFRSANFADLLALLIEHQVPLDEGVRLAGEASGDDRFRRSTRAFAESIRSGDVPSAVPMPDPKGFPPLLAWMLTAGHRQANLAEALRHASRNYRGQAERRAEILRSALPTVLMLAIGAGAVMLYALLLFVPLTTLFDELAIPSDR